MADLQDTVDQLWDDNHLTCLWYMTTTSLLTSRLSTQASHI